MHKRFITLDNDKNGVLSVDEFKQIPALAANPLLSRLIDIFDLNHGFLCLFVYDYQVFTDKTVDFNEFITGLSIFSSDAPITKKLKCLLLFV